jgi:hypothetical protein
LDRCHEYFTVCICWTVRMSRIFHCL